VCKSVKLTKGYRVQVYEVKLKVIMCKSVKLTEGYHVQPVKLTEVNHVRFCEVN
jgi:hypothetical protein